MTKLPSVRPKEVVAGLKKAGFIEERRKDSHLVMWHPEKKRTTIVAMHGKDMPPPTLKEILNQAGITAIEFIDLL